MTSNSEVTSDGVQTAWGGFMSICFSKGRFTLIESLVTGFKNYFVKISGQRTLIEAWKSL